MNDINARRSATLRATLASTRKAPPAAIASLHAQGLTDAQIARALNVTPAAVNKTRKDILQLPRHDVALATARVGAARLAVRSRQAKRAAASAALSLPPLTPTALRAVEVLASGPRTRAQVAAALGLPDGHRTYIYRLFTELKVANVISSRPVYGGVSGRRPSIWTLAPAIVATFSPTSLTPLQQRIAATPNALALADRTAASYDVRLPHLADDIRSAAYAGLTDAARRYDPTRFRFDTYAAHRIRGAIQDALRDSGPKGYRRSAEPPQIEHFMDAPQADIMPLGWEVESLDAIESLTATLPVQYRTVMRLYYGHCLTMDEIGANLGLTKSRISQIHSESLLLLRRRMAS